MANKYPANLDIVYAEPEMAFRNDLRDAIGRNGFSGVRECADIGDVNGAIRISSPDVLVFDSEMGCGKRLDFVQQLHRNKLGKNLFMSVVATCAQPDQRKIQLIAESGIDYIMVKPFAPSELIKRFDRMSKSRKPFAVSSSYIGPDRRDLIKPLADDEEVTLIEVPNTIGMKARGERIDFYELQKAIADVMSDINGERLKQNARWIAFLAGRIVEDISKKRFGKRIEEDASRLWKFHPISATVFRAAKCFISWNCAARSTSW